MTAVVERHHNPGFDPAAAPPAYLGPDVAARVRKFHAALPGYAPTPLHDMHGLAEKLSVERVWLKDESARFGLKAFKALGASWAVDQLDIEPGRVLVTATDGNHGRALAWSGAGAGLPVVVYVPGAAGEDRVDAIRAFGARVVRIDGTYDEACRRAAAAAEEHGWLLVQDVAWPGYERIPRLIMQGYLTLMHEADEQLRGESPTHLLLQCGVGSFAAAMCGYAAARWTPRPRVILVEPSRAASALAAIRSGAEQPPLLEGDTHSFMACLSCGRLSTLGWAVLRRHAEWLLTCEDDVARGGMRLLAAANGFGAPRVVSGESGAVTAGALAALCGARSGGAAREALGLTAGARVLLISTEGDTDESVYRRTLAASTTDTMTE